MKLYCECGHVKIAECCWKLRREGELFVTCQRPICAKHAKEVAPGKYVCPEHQLEYDRWLKKHPEFTGKKFEQQNLFTEAAA